MNGKLRKAAVLAIVLANGACAKSSTEPAFEPDPIVHPPAGRIVFNRMCACGLKLIRFSGRFMSWVSCSVLVGLFEVDG